MNIVKYKGLDVNPANLHESITVKTLQTPNIRLNESTGAEEYLMPRIEAIHAGATRNYNHYLAERLKGDPLKKTGVYSWMDPYAKPVIYNHDTETEVTGRILHAAYADYTQAGRPGIILIPKITEPRAVESLKAGRLLTVSVGATTNAAVCSICGTDIINEGYCGHMKGEQYDGRVCEWIAGDIWFDELSWVNVPADQDAMVVDTQTSIFINSPDNTEKATTHESSATRPLTELFGVPKGTTLVVPKTLTEADQKPAEKQGQEENRGMEKTKLEAEVIENNEPAEVTPAVVEDKPETVADAEVETPEEPAKAEESDVEEPEKDIDSEEPEAEPAQDEQAEEGLEENASVVPYEQIVLENTGLKSQVESLTAELKKILISQITEKSHVKKELKDSFEQRLGERSIESLRDKLIDLTEEMSFVAKQEPVKEEASRIVKKVVSPVPVNTESAQKETVLTEQEKVENYKKLFGL